jgi:hypothetical protein
MVCQKSDLASSPCQRKVIVLGAMRRRSYGLIVLRFQGNQMISRVVMQWIGISILFSNVFEGDHTL